MSEKIYDLAIVGAQELIRADVGAKKSGVCENE